MSKVILTEAIPERGRFSEPEKIKDALYTEEFSGSIGKFRFLPSGESELKLDLRVVKDGKIVVVE